MAAEGCHCLLTLQPAAYPELGCAAPALLALQARLPAGCAAGTCSMSSAESSLPPHVWEDLSLTPCCCECTSLTHAAHLKALRPRLLPASLLGGSCGCMPASSSCRLGVVSSAPCVHSAFCSPATSRAYSFLRGCAPPCSTVSCISKLQRCCHNIYRRHALKGRRHHALGRDGMGKRAAQAGPSSKAGLCHSEPAAHLQSSRQAGGQRTASPGCPSGCVGTQQLALGGGLRHRAGLLLSLPGLVLKGGKAAACWLRSSGL